MGNPHSEMSGSLTGVSDAVTVAKIALGMIVLILYVPMPLPTALILFRFIDHKKACRAC